jgi:beta-galactosidase
MKALDAAGLQYEKPTDVMGALSKPGSVAVIDANPANLATLASNQSKISTFTQAGGWIVLNRLTPAGLADYNKLVGVDHLIRPFRAEKVTWAKQRNPLTAGLPAANVVLGTGKKIMTFAAPEFPDPNAYSYVVDLDDIAPFGSSIYFGWNNAVNGFTQKDGAWQLIENMPPEQAVMPITLPRPEKIQQVVWCSDNNYEGCTKIEIEINGKTYPFNTEPNGDEQTFAIPDEPTATQLTIKPVDWEHNPAKAHDGQELVGIDNVWIKVARPADFFEKVKPMLNIGAMVEYPQGKGGIILCNVNFRDSEENPENMGKKRTVIATILRNLQARFAGSGESLVAGADLQYTPLDISKSANQYRGEQGWFGDKKHTFEALPPGKQVMAGVTYDIYHFTTSIVPEAIMLKGKGVPGDLPNTVTAIPVNQKADALFFLQAAHLDSKLSDGDRKKGKKYEIADYIIHYANGTTAKVPIYAGINVDDYHQPTPTAVPAAQIGWQQSYGATDGYAVAYSMQWNNPHPELEIASIDLVYGPDKRGTPAVLAITAASAK